MREVIGAGLTVLLCTAALGQTSQPVLDQFEQGKQLHREGRLEEAADVYRRVIPDLRAAEDDDNLSLALNALAYADIAAGRYRQGLEAALESLELRQRAGDDYAAVASMTNVGLAHYYLGNYPEALRYYRRALELDVELGDVEGEVIDANNVANVHYLQGDYWEALRLYQRASQLVEDHGSEPWAPQERYRTRANLATLLQKLGQPRRALEIYSDLEQGESDPAQRAQVLSNLGVLYRHLGDPYKALEQYRQAQRLFREAGSADGQIQALKNVGIALALDLGDLTRAREAFEQARRLALQTADPREQMQAELYLAEVQRRLGLERQAEETFASALESARQLETGEEIWKALYGLARLALERGDPGSARQRLQEAVGEVESLRNRLRFSSAGSGFLAGKQEVYRTLIDLLWEQVDEAAAGSASTGLLEQIVRLIEASWSAPYRDRFGQTLQARGESPEVRRLREIRGQIVAAWREEQPAGGQEDPSRRIARLEQEYLEVESRLLEGVAGLGWEPPSLGQLQDALDPGSRVLLFWASPGRLRILAVSPAAVDLRSGPLTATQHRHISECRSRVGDPDTDWTPPCGAAGRALLAPVADLLEEEGQRLLVALDPTLAGLPLEALPLPEGVLLLERHSVSYLPSLALLPTGPPARSSTVPFPWDTTLAGFGDPLLREAGAGPLSESWTPLRHARREVLAAAANLPGGDGLHLGPAATKSAFLRVLDSPPPVLHLATHAAYDPEAPERSRVLFSPGSPDGPSDFLFLAEVVGLPLEGLSLAVLSACETAAGAGSDGGADSFGRAFLGSGAAATIASLWRQDDEASAIFWSSFYREAGRGVPPSESLRRAKLDFHRSGNALAHPYYWAGFLLFGKGDDPLPLPWSWAAVATVLLTPLSLLLLAAAYRGWSRSPAR